MSRIRNADEFLLKFRQICGNYERIFGPRIAEIRQKYASGPERDIVDRNLEARVRVYIVSGEIYHCAHRDVCSAKASQITVGNRGQCGPRSGQEGQAFCEIWRFEQYLCCRACVFGEVCIKAPAFRLPCDKDNWFEKEKL